MKAPHLIVAAACLAAAGWSVAQTTAQNLGQTPAGRWLTESGNLEVEIGACGQALCGTVVKVISNRSMGGPAMAMAAAPADAGAAAPTAAPAAPARPLLGLGILHDVAPAGGGQWRGRIYNRERDASFDCLIGLDGPDLLKVNILVAPALPPKVQFWRRVAAATAP